jgi:hypothetical protein
VSICVPLAKLVRLRIASIWLCRALACAVLENTGSAKPIMDFGADGTAAAVRMVLRL